MGSYVVSIDALLCTRASKEQCQQKLTDARRGEGERIFPFSIVHGHPKEQCQQKLADVRGGRRGEGHSPT